jgi:hypothetical protein
MVSSQSTNCAFTPGNQPFPKRHAPGYRSRADDASGRYLANGRGGGISFDALAQRLALVAHLQLPCVVHLPGLDRRKPVQRRIRACQRVGNHLELSGENFHLSITDAELGLLRVVGRRPPEIEIRSTNGNVIVRIAGPSETAVAGVWQDVIDTFDTMA